MNQQLKKTDTVAYSNTHTLYYGARRGLWVFHDWTPSTKELKGISYTNALYPMLPRPVATHTVGICTRTLISLLMDHCYTSCWKCISDKTVSIWVNQETDCTTVWKNWPRWFWRALNVAVHCSPNKTTLWMSQRKGRTQKIIREMQLTHTIPIYTHHTSVIIHFQTHWEIGFL